MRSWSIMQNYVICIKLRNFRDCVHRICCLSLCLFFFLYRPLTQPMWPNCVQVLSVLLLFMEEKACTTNTSSSSSWPTPLSFCGWWTLPSLWVSVPSLVPLPLTTGPLENRRIFHCGRSSLPLDEQYGEPGALDVSLVVYPTKALCTPREGRPWVSNESD